MLNLRKYMLNFKTKKRRDTTTKPSHQKKNFPDEHTNHLHLNLPHHHHHHRQREPKHPEVITLIKKNYTLSSSSHNHMCYTLTHTTNTWPFSNNSLKVFLAIAIQTSSLKNSSRENAKVNEKGNFFIFSIVVGTHIRDRLQ